MTHEEKAGLLQELCTVCDQIYAWTYDASGELLSSNCADEAVLDTAFSAFGGKDRMLAAAAQGDNPVKLGSSMGLVWGAAFEKDEEGSLQRCWVLGPVLYTSLSRQQIELGYGNNQKVELGLAWKERFIQAVRTLPVLSNVLLDRYMIMLHYCLTGVRLYPSDLSQSIEQVKTPQAPDPIIRDRDQVYANERAMLATVRNGDLDYKKVLGQVTMFSSGVPVHGKDPLRQSKTSLTVFTSLVCRAAIEGGLSPEEAYSLGDRYIQSAENAKTLDELSPLSIQMFEDFIRRVHNHRTLPGISAPIRRCVDYIETHLDRKLRAAELAALVGYNEYYFTRRFKRETGYTVSNYVRYARVEKAKLMLGTGKLPVQQIADQLGFSSRSYFIQCFRETTGMTPMAWRNRHGRD